MKCKTETSVIIDSTYNEEEDSTIVDPAKTGKFIKLLRSKHNLSQQALADQLYLSRKAVSKWENGRCCPSTDTLKILSKIFNVSLEELLNGKFNIVPDEYLPLHKRIIKKIIKNKTFRTISIIVAVTFIGCLLSFYYTHKDGEQYYELTVNTDVFSLPKGYIYYRDKSYIITLGIFRSFIEGNVSENYDLNLYIKTEDNKIYNIYSQKIGDNEALNNVKIPNEFKRILEQNINNIYIDVTSNQDDNPVEYNGIKIIAKKSNLDIDEKEIKSQLVIATFDQQEDTAKANLTDIPNLKIDISKIKNGYEKLLKLNTEKIAINFNNKNFYFKLIENSKIKLYTKEEDAYIIIQDDVIYIVQNNVINIISIKGSYIIFNSNNSHYYESVKNLIDQLIALLEP